MKIIFEEEKKNKNKNKSKRHANNEEIEKHKIN